MLVIADTSALIAIATCNGLPWLNSLFEKLMVPRAVFEEAIKKDKPQAARLQEYLTDKVFDSNLAEFVIASPGMGDGELEAMALYRKTSADRLLIDDLRARKVALYNGMNVIGSVGVLLLAKKHGLISAIKPCLDQIDQSEVHMGRGLMREALIMAGED